ncbi:TetR/AcrR family transcriptional regulator [Fodinicola feengrottensis]|uniref:TetR/AcrR family transcriptional regulator n=1 Tax=Fodinicola feengrottensis TaxID=435914 RepID=A0ABN2GS89_9ACTN|nr:TetR/AcrR family transcriptional regulator [Fodinicola feengrottensis]
MAPDPRRPHTGRRRNEAARQAILDATSELLGQPNGAALTIDMIAAAAGVGKQTIYRWWPSKGAVLLEAMTDLARTSAPTPDTGALASDLHTFLASTFHAAGSEPAASRLRTVMAEAQRDPHAGELMRIFADRRRQELRQILIRAQDRGELLAPVDLDLVTDQVYGVLWYRLLIGHSPLSPAAAAELSAALLKQLLCVETPEAR